MVRVGEETGRLEEMLLKVAEAFESDVRTELKRVLGMLEPAIILGHGGSRGVHRRGHAAGHLLDQRHPAMKRSLPGSSAGFTLIELLVVIIVLGLLVGLVGPRLFGRVGQSKQAAAQAQIELIGAALDQYRLDVGAYPNTSQGLRLAAAESQCDELERPLSQEVRAEGPVGQSLQVPLLSRAARRLRPVVGGRRRRARWRRGKRRHRVMGSGEAIGRRGFTLLELIVTLFVVALVTAIAVPTIGRSTEAVRVRADVATFSAMLRHARERAITTRKGHAVVVDPGAHRMSIVSGSGVGEVRESRSLPERLEITADAAARPHGPLRAPGGLERRRFPARHRDDRLSRHGRCPHRSGPERPRVSRQGGFTLLEVLVAFAILSITIVVAVQGFAQGLRLLKLSGDHQSAILIADQRAREVVMPKEGHENGTDGSYTWDRTIKELPTPELDVPGRAARWHVYQIDVQVAWGDGRRSVGVTTLRTVSDADEKEAARR